MRSDLVVDVTPTTINTALTEDGKLVSLQRESRDASYAVGNLYLAKVKKLSARKVRNLADITRSAKKRK